MSFHLSGIDEAGYGPLLGPLVVGLSTLKVEEPISPAMPWKLLTPTVTRKKSKRGLAIADSKLLHKGEDLTPLESGVLAFISAEKSPGEGPLVSPVPEERSSLDESFDEGEAEHDAAHLLQKACQRAWELLLVGMQRAYRLGQPVEPLIDELRALLK